jgi:hypothetical protein
MNSDDGNLPLHAQPHGDASLSSCHTPNVSRRLCCGKGLSKRAKKLNGRDESWLGFSNEECSIRIAIVFTTSGILLIRSEVLQ